LCESCLSYFLAGLFIARLFRLQPRSGHVTSQSDPEQQEENIQQTLEDIHVLRITGLTRFDASMNIALKYFSVAGLSISSPELSVEREYSKEGKPVVEVRAGTTKIKRMVLNQTWAMRSQLELSVVLLFELSPG
jgi:hypothetical protein